MMSASKNKLLVLSLLAMGVSQQALAVDSSPTGPVKGRAPVMAVPTIAVIEDVGVGGKIDTGDVLEAKPGTFTDDDKDQPGAHVFQWYSGADKIVDANTSKFTVTNAEAGKSISVGIVPWTDPAITDPAFGLEVKSLAKQVSQSGAIISVAINGIPEVDQTLTAVPTCNIACVDGSVKYEWWLETGGQSGWALIAGQTGVTYKVRGTDQKKRIMVKATTVATRSAQGDQ